MHRCCRQFCRFCSSFQVELRGNYTPEKIITVSRYLQTTSILRSLLVSALSPLPCLLIIALVDCVPLAPPESGSRANVVFWGRDFVSLAMLSAAILVQFRMAVPRLNITLVHVVTITLASTASSIASKIAMAALIGFPLPFALVLGIPGTMVVVISSAGIFCGSKLKRDAVLRKEVLNFLQVLNCPMILMLVYPIYLYGFIHLKALGQNIYLVLLPVIKSIGKNWISYFLGSKYDLLSQIAIFNMDVFHAMYVSSSIQTAKSLTTIVITVVLDVLLAYMSLYDVETMVKKVDVLRRKLPASHPLKSASVVSIVFQIIKEDDRARVWLSQRRYLIGSAVLKQAKTTNGSEATNSTNTATTGSAQVRVMPRMEDLVIEGVETFNLPQHRQDSLGQHTIDRVLSEKERQQFTERIARLLFTTEFVILALYTKFIVPLIFVSCTAILFYLPNHAYYQQLHGYDDDVLKAKVRNVAFLAVSQLLVLVICGVKLQRRLNIPMLHMVSFGLEYGRMMVQTNLLLSIFFPIENSLQHNGADFSFSFSWLKNKSTP